MRLLGRQVSRLWLLLLVFGALLCLPLLLVVLLAVDRIAGGILGPPPIWNRPLHSPDYRDLVGHYIERKRNWDHEQLAPAAVLDLHSDGTIQVTDLPQDSGAETCNLSGRGRWSRSYSQDDQALDLVITKIDSGGTCEVGSYSLLEISGRSAPYALYWVLVILIPAPEFGFRGDSGNLHRTSRRPFRIQHAGDQPYVRHRRRRCPHPLPRS